MPRVRAPPNRRKPAPRTVSNSKCRPGTGPGHYNFSALTKRGRKLRLRLRFVPVVADAEVDGQRRVERIRAAHLLAHKLFYGPHLPPPRPAGKLLVPLGGE